MQIHAHDHDGALILDIILTRREAAGVGDTVGCEDALGFGLEVAAGSVPVERVRITVA